MAMQTPATERSPLLHDASPSNHTRIQALAARVRRGMHRHRQPLLVAVAVAAGAIALFMAYVVFIDGSTPMPLGSSDNGDDEVYDAIVIGGGPAGAVISKLLSDDPWRKVLLIEAGDASQVELGGQAAIASPHNTERLTPFDVPFYWTNVANTPALHWDYPGVNVAKALGGCGIHNAMLYVRALPIDLERWAMPTWTWAKALDLYMTMEDYGAGQDVNTTVHGVGGNVRTSSAGAARDALSDQFVRACERVGIGRTHDFNAPGGRTGAGFYDFNTRNGVRESAARVFLGPLLQGHAASQRPNFQLLLNTTVTRVVISDDNVAKGVAIKRADGSHATIRVASHGHVVVTAGAINTPKLLMQSGVGDATALEALGIRVVKDLPRVGMNLQDHPVLGVTFESRAPAAFDLEAALETYFSARAAKASHASAYGDLGTAGIAAGAFVVPPGSTAPEIQLTFFPRKSEPHLTNSSALNHTAELLVTVALLTPRARNRIVLEPRSTDFSTDTDTDTNDLVPRVASEVPGRELEEEHLRGDDVWKLAWGVRVVREIAAVLVEQGLAGKELSPGPEIEAPDALNAWVHGAVFRNSHWVGSASMATTEAAGVVDARLRVFGVRNLRVADASVIPTIPNGNVHSTVLMVAAHAAEILREDDAAAAVKRSAT